MTAMLLPAGSPSVELSFMTRVVAEYLAELVPAVLSDADLVAELRARETVRRQLEAADHVLIAELDRRGLGAACGARSTAGLLSSAFRLSPRDASDRVTAARHLGPRPMVTGAVLPPLLPAAAAAQAAGELSREHVRVIIAAIAELPTDLPVGDFERADAILTRVAQQCTPRDVFTAGVRLVDTLLPDGAEPSDAEHHQRRSLGVHRRRDGSYDLSGRLTPECGIEAEAVLHTYAAPRPSVNDATGAPVADDRTPAHRMHDGLHDLFGLALRADTLTHTGRRAELIITTHANTDFEGDNDVETDVEGENTVGGTGAKDAAARTAAPAEASNNATPHRSRRTPATGPVTATVRFGRRAWTSFGQPLGIRTALRLCDTARITTVTLTHHGDVLNYGHTRRFASDTQLRALIARDGGCSFPGCDHPPQWCDIHHITEWSQGGPTNLNNLTLLCGYHHRRYQRMGWTCHLQDGIPQWTPPPHIDPNQTPQRHHRHLLR